MIMSNSKIKMIEYVLSAVNSIETNDFSMMDYRCDFCSNFYPNVVQIPSTTLLICKQCLDEMSNALDKSTVEEMVTEIRELKSEKELEKCLKEAKS